ncbi:MAG: glycosyltransferase family 4 protein, partial [Clostridia bacterium]|nr:glycosyltransferase family 4 protein [Clostridia bacterium]
KDTKELLNVTDVNVISSSSEAMSLAILEAMSLGKPTVATNVGGNPQLVRHKENGFLVDFGDAHSMCTAFLEIFENKELYSKFSQNASGMFFSEFTAEIMVKNLQKLYWEVSNGK